MDLATSGAICFGAVIGWITYRTLRRKKGSTALTDIITVIGAIGGAAITSLFNDKDLFGAYSVGLAIGFFLYFIIGLLVPTSGSVQDWMGD